MKSRIATSLHSIARKTNIKGELSDDRTSATGRNGSLKQSQSLEVHISQNIKTDRPHVYNPLFLISPCQYPRSGQPDVLSRLKWEDNFFIRIARPFAINILQATVPTLKAPAQSNLYSKTL